MLLTPNAKVQRYCKIVWRNGGYVGIRFLTDRRFFPSEKIISSLEDSRPQAAYIG